MNLFLVATLSLLWGSFLNVVAFRWIQNKSIVTPRSYCPHCKQPIAWYDNIPVLSWLMLCGQCRSCKQPISWLYPFIELFTAASLIALYLSVPPHYLFAYVIFFSALIVIIRTDLEHMLIMQATTLYIIPIAYVLSYTNMLPISLWQSVIGSCIGYGSLWSIAYLYYICTKKQGLGAGDFDLLACIGAFTGVEGVLCTLLIGSWLGSIISIVYILYTKQGMQTRIPFAPFLALGAMIYVCLQDAIHAWLLYL